MPLWAGDEVRNAMKKSESLISMRITKFQEGRGQVGCWAADGGRHPPGQASPGCPKNRGGSPFRLTCHSFAPRCGSFDLSIQREEK